MPLCRQRRKNKRIFIKNAIDLFVWHCEGMLLWQTYKNALSYRELLSLSLKFMIQNLERFFRRIPKFFTFCIVSLQETGKSRQNPEACPVGSLDWMLCKQSITNLTIFQMIKTLAKNASLFRSWHFYQTNFEGFIAKRRRIVKWLLFNYSRVQRFRNTNITLPTIVNAQQKYSW